MTNQSAELTRLNIALGFDSTAIITEMPRALSRYVNLLRTGDIKATAQSEIILSQVNDCIELRGNDKEADFLAIESAHRDTIAAAGSKTVINFD